MEKTIELKFVYIKITMFCAGDIKYCSATYRLFKVDPKQEKSLTMVKYLGKQCRVIIVLLIAAFDYFVIQVA